MTQLFNQPTLTLRLSASLSVERKLSKGTARHSSLPFNCNWDMIDPICSQRKPLSDRAYLLVSLMVLGYLESNREQVTLRLGETSESNGSDAVGVLWPSWFLEVVSVKSSFSWGFSMHTWSESSLLVSDSVFLFIVSHFLYRNLSGGRNDFSFGESLRNRVCNLSKVKNRENKKSYLSLGIKEEVTRNSHYREKNVHWASW